MLATGAVEQPLVMAGNDRPGVMLAEAAVRYLDLYGVRVGQRVAVVSNNAEGLRAAARLREAGVAVVAVVAVGDLPCPPELANDLLHRPEAISIRGGRRVRRVTHEGPRMGERPRLPATPCSCPAASSLPCSYGRRPGGRVQWSEAAQALLPVGIVDGVMICGAAAGTTESTGAAASGALAGESALAVLAGRPAEPAETFGGPGVACAGDVAMRPVRAGEPAFVDIHNDVTRDDLELAMREGYRSIDHVKRYTTLGMGPDQGRTSARNGARLTAGDTPPSTIRTTTMRPPWRPVPFAAVAGTRAGTARLALALHAADGMGQGSRRGDSTSPGPTGAGQATSRRTARRSPRRREAGSDWRSGSASASTTHRRWARSACAAPTAPASSTSSMPAGSAR